MEEEILKEKAKKGMEFAIKAGKIVSDKEKSKGWARKMATFTEIARQEKNPALLLGLIGTQLSKEEMGLATLMLIRQESKGRSPEDIAFM